MKLAVRVAFVPFSFVHPSSFRDLVGPSDRCLVAIAILGVVRAQSLVLVWATDQMSLDLPIRILRCCHVLLSKGY